MTLLAATPNPPAGQLALALLLAVAGFFLLLPRPRGRSVAGGTAAVLAAAVVLGAWAHETFGEPGTDWVGRLLFILFSTGAVGFGTVLVAQRNPARGAIAFAFVILSTCGLFLLLAAPFLMAATLIVYAGAIIVTFLFVLMLSQAAGPSDENDRSREPLLGSLAGFAFAGLVLFTLHEAQDALTPTAAANTVEAKRATPLPAPVLTPDEQHKLADVAEKLTKLDADEFYGPPTAEWPSNQARTEYQSGIEQSLEEVVGESPNKAEGTIRDGSVHARLAGLRADVQAKAVLDQAAKVRDLGHTAFKKVYTASTEPKRVSPAEARAEVRKLREEVLLLHGTADLPARNVGNLGLLLFADHLLAVELAGTLLLVATIGAVAIAHRKGGQA
jgi:NADH:ubiquinone oxidoreductase subunit 6 (subunit J)